MTRKTRLIIVGIFTICFCVGAIILIPYSVGYRFDFKKMKIVATGGIYVKTYPLADEITIDYKIKEKPNIFSNYVFVQSLLPNNYTVLVKKAGYYDYSKTIPVQEKEVTKLENILLIKENLQFNPLPKNAKSPFDQPADKAPAIKNMLTYANTGNKIIWLSTDGFLYQSEDPNDKNLQKITTTALKVSKKLSYKIIASGPSMLLNNNGILLVYNKDKGDLESFAITSAYKKVIDCQWINDYNIVFLSEGKIIISETDTRSNLNSVIISQLAEKIYYNKQEGKLYLSTGTKEQPSILVSEKFAP